jgi:hypothetical protein
MSAPEIATSVEHAQQRGIAAAPASAKPRPAVNGTANAVIWNECIDADLAADAARSTLGLTLDVVSAAGSGTLEDDRAALRAVAKDARSVLVIAPAWEPPLLEFGDFLGELRAALGAGPSIVVLPIGERGTASTALERETWTRAVQRNADRNSTSRPANCERAAIRHRRPSQQRQEQHRRDFRRGRRHRHFARARYNDTSHSISNARGRRAAVRTYRHTWISKSA